MRKTPDLLSVVHSSPFHFLSYEKCMFLKGNALKQATGELICYFAQVQDRIKSKNPMLENFKHKNGLFVAENSSAMPKNGRKFRCFKCEEVKATALRKIYGSHSSSRSSSLSWGGLCINLFPVIQNIQLNNMLSLVKVGGPRSLPDGQNIYIILFRACSLLPLLLQTHHSFFPLIFKLHSRTRKKRPLHTPNE